MKFSLDFNLQLIEYLHNKYSVKSRFFRCMLSDVERSFGLMMFAFPTVGLENSELFSLVWLLPTQHMFSAGNIYGLWYSIV